MRPSVLIVAAVSLGISVALLSLHRSPKDEPATSAPPPASPARTQAASIPEPAPVATTTPEPAAAATTRSVDVLMSETQSGDARTRADAIAELSRSSDPRAVGALRRVLDDGDPQTDQPLALQSLHAMALQRGDRDGTIRDALRYAVFHATDEAVIQSAQAMLDELEATIGSPLTLALSLRERE